MLSNEIRYRRLFVRWEADASVAFGCTMQLSGTPLSYLLNKKVLGMQTAEMTEQSLRALGALASQVEVSPAAVDEASKFLERLDRFGAMNHSALEARAVMLLSQGNLKTIRDFCKWAARVSVQSQYAPDLWTGGVWRSLSQSMASPVNKEIEEKINRYLAIFSSDDTSGSARVEALCDLYDQLLLPQVYNGVMPAVLVRLMLGLMNSLACWPLLVVSTEQKDVPVSLPVFAELQGLGLNDVAQPVHTNRRAVYTKCRGSRFQNPHNLRSDVYGFEGVMLRWDREFHRGMEKGLSVAKNLWLSQNRRIDNLEVLRNYENCSMEIEFTSACQIVNDWKFDEALMLKGRSAEGYWVQVALGLLLPGRRSPLGTCSATVEDHRQKGEYALGSVEGIASKLAYASRLGILQKLVLPNTGPVLKQIEDAYRDDENGIKTEIIENSLCHTVRDAADVLQVNGWRRARFVSAPGMRGGFGRLSNSLFELDDAGIPVSGRLPVDHPMYATLCSARNDLQQINQLKIFSDKSSVLFLPYLVDEQGLGLWAAHVDHKTRIGNNPLGYKAPGLGLLAIKTRPGESHMRFWAHVFDQLQASTQSWDSFQFGTLEQSAGALSALLNNFSGDPQISRQPAPDLLVIFDEAGATQDWGVNNQKFVDERGNLRLLLNTQAILQQGRTHHLANQLTHRDGVRTGVFGLVRIVVIYYPKNPRPRLLPVGTELSDLDVLRIFRGGFTLHSAQAVLNAYRQIVGKQDLEWLAVREIMVRLKDAGSLKYGRGEYYFRTSGGFDPRLSGAALLHEAAGLAFMPTISSGADSRRNRKLEITSGALREAAWHFSQMYGLASDLAVRNRARQHLSALGLLTEREDWDTVQALAYDRKSFGEESKDTALALLSREAESVDCVPYHGHCALALNAFSASLSTLFYDKRVRVDSHSLEKLLAAFEATASQIRRWHTHKPTQYMVEAIVQSETAYFLGRLIRHCKDGGVSLPSELWRDIHTQIRQINSELKRVVDDLWSANPAEKYWASVSLQHGWCAANWADHQGAVKYAYAACATDRSPSPVSWAALFAEMPLPNSSQTSEQDLRHILLLWQEKIDDPLTFAARMKAEEQLRTMVSPETKLLAKAKQALGIWAKCRLVNEAYRPLLQEACACFE